jgi:predicted nucleotidyltransferase
MDPGTEPFLTSRTKTGTIQSERMSGMINEKITHYFETRHEVAAVYLFGSYAGEKNHPASDVDLAILFLPEHLPSANRFCNRYLTELGRLLRKDIQDLSAFAATIMTAFTL